MSTLTEIIKQFSGQHNTLTLQRPYIKFTGSPEGGLLLSQMIYWADRTKDPNGWFYKTYPEWEEEIGIKKRAVSKFASAWVDVGFLETDVRRSPQGTPVVHYRFSIDRFSEKLTDFLESADRHDGKSQSARTSIYTSTTTSISSSTTSIQDPECAIEEVKTCQVEICLEPEQIEASQPLAPDQTGTTPSVKRSKKGRDKYSAPGVVALVSPAVPEMPVEADTPTTVCVVMGDGDYERFRVKYTDLCVDVHRKYGKSEDVKKAWKVAWKGLEPPDRFWFGLDCYIEQQQAEYAKTGECWMVGAKRFLDADEVHWESAIRKYEVSQKTQSFGVDIDSPSSMKRANIVSNNQKNWAIARQQLIAEGRAV